jgi:hypothetical protein
MRKSYLWATLLLAVTTVMSVAVALYCFDPTPAQGLGIPRSYDMLALELTGWDAVLRAVLCSLATLLLIVDEPKVALAVSVVAGLVAVVMMVVFGSLASLVTGSLALIGAIVLHQEIIANRMSDLLAEEG